MTSTYTCAHNNISQYRTTPCPWPAGFPPTLEVAVRWQNPQRNPTPSYLGGGGNVGKNPCASMLGTCSGANSARRSFRSFWVTGAGHRSKAQTRWWQGNNRGAAEECPGDWSLQSTAGAAMPYFSGSGENSTTTQWASQEVI